MKSETCASSLPILLARVTGGKEMEKAYYVSYSFKTKGLFSIIGTSAEILINNMVTLDVEDLIGYLTKTYNYKSVIILFITETLMPIKQPVSDHMQNKFVN